MGNRVSVKGVHYCLDRRDVQYFEFRPVIVVFFLVLLG